MYNLNCDVGLFFIIDNLFRKLWNCYSDTEVEGVKTSLSICFMIYNREVNFQNSLCWLGCDSYTLKIMMGFEILCLIIGFCLSEANVISQTPLNSVLDSDS